VEKTQLDMHLEMLEASVDSPTLTDQDRLELFELVIDFCRGKTPDAKILIETISRFHDRKPALYADCVRTWFSKHHQDEDVLTLLRQISDPEVDEEAVSRSLVHLAGRCRAHDKIDPIEMMIIAPMVLSLREESFVDAQLQLSLDNLERVLEGIIIIELKPADDF